MKSCLSFLILISLLASPFAMAENNPAASNWPGWRGDGSGVSADKNLPTYWSDKDNVAWKTPLPGEGNSSPIVWGDRVFLTASTDKGQKRVVLCLSAKDGGILWQTPLGAGKPAQTHAKNGYASSTPVCDGRRVYAFFDSPGLVALDHNGARLWTRPLGPFKSVWNLAASPILCGDLVVMCCDHDGQSFIVAVDRATGEEKWRTPRIAKSQYATPIVIEHKGRAQIVVSGGPIFSYDAATGKELWTCRGMKKPPDTIVPTPLYHNGLLYFTCGRDGPTMAVDPGGAGDVTDTRVRFYMPTGGSYVPSPLFYPTLLLADDDGLLRFLDDKGKPIVTHKLAGRFTASPVGAEGRMYWPSEGGGVFVVDVSNAARGDVRFLGVNDLGEHCLASPAVAGGRMYFRTEKRLFCVANLGAKRPIQPPQAVKGTFAQLRKQYEDNYPPKGNNTAARLAVIEAMGDSTDPDAAPFLLDAVQTDFDWDVNEAAAKSLARLGGASEKQMIRLLAFPRSHLQIIAADHLGKLRSADAAPGLVKLCGAEDSDEFVRMVCIRALGAIVKAHAALAPRIVPVVVRGLRDDEGTVRQAALDAAAILTPNTREGDETFKALMDCAADPNPQIAAKAGELVMAVSKSAGELIRGNRILYGSHRKAGVTEDLVAGPIRLKFQDGQLRYICVGQREIVRRIYFAVRDPKWDTVVPAFGRMDVAKRPDGFHAAFTGLCKGGPIDYGFGGEIDGSADGKITFRVRGLANAAFQSPRIGLCVLYGSTLAGTEFQTTGAGGKAAAGKFPVDISPNLLAANYQTLQYAAGGMTIRCSLEGGSFSMEDQRVFGDSSYKAYGPLPYAYPAVEAGGKGEQVLTLQVAGAKPQPVAEGPVRIEIGPPLKGVKMPRLAGPDEKPPKDAVTMNYTPALHLFDDDALMENPPDLADLARFRRKEAKAPAGAPLVVWPATIEPPYPRAQRDPRNSGLFAAAWSAWFLKCATAAGVDAVKFDVGPSATPSTAAPSSVAPSYAATIQESLGSLAGCQVLETKVQSADPIPVGALALDKKGRKVVYVINKTDRPQQVVLTGLEGKCELWRLNESTALAKSATTAPSPAPTTQEATAPDGTLRLELKPFEVCRVSMTSK